jgi:dCMP deaminase
MGDEKGDEETQRFNLDKLAKNIATDITETEKALSAFANKFLLLPRGSRNDSDRPTWDESFMLAAYHAATRSSCHHIYAGAVVVKDKRVIASGYNGAPTDIKNCLEVGCRKDELGIQQNNRGTGNCRGAHAERNAMDQIARPDLIGCNLYTVTFPCSDCAKSIVGNQIARVHYSISYHEQDSLTKGLFEEAKIELIHLPVNLEKYYLTLKRIQNQGRR